jgi:hypothetical protein
MIIMNQVTKVSKNKLKKLTWQKVKKIELDPAGKK